MVVKTLYAMSGVIGISCAASLQYSRPSSTPWGSSNEIFWMLSMILSSSGFFQRMLLEPVAGSPLASYNFECQELRKKIRLGSPPQVSMLLARLAEYSQLPMMGHGLA